MSIRYKKNISNPTKFQTPTMSLKHIFNKKHIFSSDLSKWIDYHPASGDMLDDQLFLCNNIASVVK